MTQVFYRTASEDGEHSHYPDTTFFTRDELLALEYLDGGTIRVVHEMPDGYQEVTALGNLLGIIARFCTDAEGNKFGGYFVLPEEFWQSCVFQLRQRQLHPELLLHTAEEGILGIFAHFTVYIGGCDKVLLRSDHNGCCWAFTIGTQHELLRRPQALALVGPSKGFDDRVYYLPFRTWGWLGYTPAPVLAQWAAGGDHKALAALQQMALEIPVRRMALAAVGQLQHLGKEVSEEAFAHIERLALREQERGAPVLLPRVEQELQAMLTVPSSPEG